MPYRKLTPDQQREIIPDDSVHRAFLRRPDIQKLSPDEQERRWASHLESVNAFRQTLSEFKMIVPGAASMPDVNPDDTHE